MINAKVEQKRIYNKSHSFEIFKSNIQSDINYQKQRIVKILENEKGMRQDGHGSIYAAITNELKTGDISLADFRITEYISDEVSRLDDKSVSRYMFHRYRYDVYPKRKILDDYPPYLQIEPTSICNYRCVFCYQTDESFSNKSSGHMGSMKFELFKEIIDQAEGKVDFISLASRGEPFICKDIDRMLEYCIGKFLGLKINTNASLLTERYCHAILAGGVNTIVFSADAAEEPLYSQLRVHGRLEKVLRNIEMFQKIRIHDYPKSKIITRVSGVKVSDKQDMSSMMKMWGGLVDQIAFVAYNPWENVYDSPLSNIMTPCSDLWRRMFIWFDGIVNPCDTDFKSTLSVGNIGNANVSELWRSPEYMRLREIHLKKLRLSQNPCKRCTVI